MKIAITTSLGKKKELVEKARALGERYHFPVLDRRKTSLKSLMASYDALLVIYEGKWVLEQADGSSFYFHPDTAMLRVKNNQDPLLSLLGDEPLSVLDTTMGLASDSLVLAYAGHHVVALESSPIISLMVQEGLATYQSGNAKLDAAMRSLQVITTDNLTYLKSVPDNAFDVVYVDPMFSEKIPESENLSGLRLLANTQGLTSAFIEEAKRVARRQIILKAHFRDDAFERFGFIRQRRPNQKFHYGKLVCQDS